MRRVWVVYWGGAWGERRWGALAQADEEEGPACGWCGGDVCMCARPARMLCMGRGGLLHESRSRMACVGAALCATVEGKGGSGPPTLR